MIHELDVALSLELREHLSNGPALDLTSARQLEEGGIGHLEDMLRPPEAGDPARRVLEHLCQALPLRLELPAGPHPVDGDRHLIRDRVEEFLLLLQERSAIPLGTRLQVADLDPADPLTVHVDGGREHPLCLGEPLRAPGLPLQIDPGRCHLGVLPSLGQPVDDVLEPNGKRPTVGMQDRNPAAMRQVQPALMPEQIVDRPGKGLALGQDRDGSGRRHGQDARLHAGIAVGIPGLGHIHGATVIEFHAGGIIQTGQDHFGAEAVHDHGGSGIGRYQGKAVFIPLTAPGDRVRARFCLWAVNIIHDHVREEGLSEQVQSSLHLLRHLVTGFGDEELLHQSMASVISKAAREYGRRLLDSQAFAAFADFQRQVSNLQALGYEYALHGLHLPGEYVDVSRRLQALNVDDGIDGALLDGICREFHSERDFICLAALGCSQQLAAYLARNFENGQPTDALIYAIILIGALIFLLQWLLLGRLDIFGAFPDAVLLYIAWLGLRFGRRAGAVAGFTLGFLMDVIMATWGIHMFVKTLVGFFAGLFAVDERKPLLIQPQQAFLGGLAISLLHNGLLVILVALETEATNAFLIYALWLGSALYTAVVAYIGTLFIQ